jgi:DNA-binding CsgD family transcriptional regulator
VVRTQRAWTIQEIRAAEAWRSEGMTIRAIADRLHRSVASVKGQLAAQKGRVGA